MSDDMSAYRDVFLSESAEYIQSITDGLLALEANPNDLEPVETVFRGAHSLKGMAAAMGYGRTAELTHKMESLMDTVRKRVQRVDASLIDLMLQAVDAVRALIDDESNGRTTYDAQPIIDALIARTEARPSATGADEVAVPAERDEAVAAATGSTTRITVRLEPTCVLKAVRAYMVLKRLGYVGEIIGTEPSARDIEDERFDDSFVVTLRTQESPDAIVRAIKAISEVDSVDVAIETTAPRSATARVSQDVTEQARAIPKVAETQTVRISIGHLDNMVNLVGELVIIRARLENLAREIERPELTEALGALQQITGELQHEVMQTRMVPVGNIFNRFPRMVRDLARDLGKQVAFEMEGLDIELDRTVLDEIGDPIVHLLRNAVDHGIESVEEREAAGKPPKGAVRLVAERDRDQVRIIVSDDGRGMDPERIWAKAVERGLVDASERDAYTDADILMLTCTPGFSTAAQATQVSGRGVGMDVVKGKIEYLGGTVMIRSVPNEGTETVLTLPLTLAIIQALLVGTAEQVFAVPLSAVSEVLAHDDVKVKTVDGGPVAVLRDERVVPIHRLDEVIGSLRKRGSKRSAPDRADHIVLIDAGHDVQALAVKRLIGRQEIVIKPLSPVFKELKGLGGATVLGDGRVALILDPRTLFEMGA